MKTVESHMYHEGTNHGYEAATTVEPSIRDTKLAVWDERDRLHIALQDLDGTYLVDWWDDDARDMFVGGFFKPGRELHASVFEYALEHGLLHRLAILAKLAFQRELETREDGWGWWIEQYGEVPARDDPLWTSYEKGVNDGITHGLRERCGAARAARLGVAPVCRRAR